MKTDKFVLALIMVVVLTAGIFSIVRTSYNSERHYSSLTLQNIEALSEGDDDEGFDSSHCSFGAPMYGVVRSLSGKFEVIEHFSNGINGSRGTDWVYTVDYIGCKATGSGKLQGSSYRVPIDEGPRTERECIGEAGHRRFPY